ncbi:hypothetical protein HDU91_000155 [Kappamyces sp. JEL0680]|nr:hypothetical protein HDU91_000155 [Kappamyces sp. JEL0680]
MPQTQLSHFLSNKQLLCFHVVFVLWTTWYLVFQLCRAGGFYFYFLTNNGWDFLVLYSWSNLFLHLELSPDAARVHSLIHRILFAATQTLAWLISLGFWVLLSGPIFQGKVAPGGVFTSSYAHATNLIMATVSLFLSTTTVGWRYIVAPLVAVAIYTTAVASYHLASNSDWPYPFLKALDGQNGGLAPVPTLILCAALVVGCTLFFAFTRFLISVRDRRKVVKVSEKKDHDLELARSEVDKFALVDVAEDGTEINVAVSRAASTES